ncbi:hypothetical protein ASF80_09895 [Microbacterium sp. Leaf159]|nr:hypothetical protein ASF80_09895 [Microbacterium sp. Leaf159]
MRQYGAMRHRSSTAACAIALISLTALTGCSFTSTTLAVFETDRVAEDELPPLEEDSYSPVDVESSRYVGEYEGVSLWIAKGTDSSTCLVAITDPEDDWGIGCGGLPTRISGSGHTFEVRADDWPAPEGMTRVSDNVYAE